MASIPSPSLIICFYFFSFSVIALSPSFLQGDDNVFLLLLLSHQMRWAGGADGGWQGVSEPSACLYLYFWHVIPQSHWGSARFRSDRSPRFHFSWADRHKTQIKWFSCFYKWVVLLIFWKETLIQMFRRLVLVDWVKTDRCTENKWKMTIKKVHFDIQRRILGYEL